jgi:hypothetical protein
MNDGALCGALLALLKKDIGRTTAMYKNNIDDPVAVSMKCMFLVFEVWAILAACLAGPRHFPG